ncbi:nucleotidyltransferase domain-containing protein [Calidithermus roseus]|uniref:Nucleotidyltransferase domain protein n=1 Tax=Calidithermus roseus TaxID=1644118 RepID=A0A399EVM4_9DEIN|nr:nucleotidyltransferase domain-containing protein [Calidithermus roseus]RIH87650.1 Nucleotidyltransferase domain protein [Calidithermus roseus]
MPVRSLRSSVITWPSREAVEQVLREWLQRLELPGLLAAGYFGSYARGDQGPGSDLDIILIVQEASLPPWQRPRLLPLEELPVPAEALVYTETEWRSLPRASPRFARTLALEARWLIGPPTL